jgi:hypothetical protein
MKTKNQNHTGGLQEQKDTAAHHHQGEPSGLSGNQKRLRFARVLLSVFAVACFSPAARAVNVLTSQASFSVEIVGTNFDWSYTVSKTDGVSYGIIALHEVDLSGTPIGAALFTFNAVADPLTASGVTPYDSTKRYRMRAMQADWSNVIIASSIHIFEPASTEYYVKFNLPKNNNPVRQIILARQNGLTVGSYSLAHGAGPVTWTIGPLLSDDPVTLIQYAGGDLEWDEANQRWDLTANTQYFPASVATLPSAGETGDPQPSELQHVSPSPFDLPPPTPPTPPTPIAPIEGPGVVVAPVAPTPTAAPTAPTPIADTSGDAGADQVTRAVNSVASSARDNAAKIIESVDAGTLSTYNSISKLLDATNTTNVQVHGVAGTVAEGSNKIVEAIKENTEATNNLIAQQQPGESAMGALNTYVTRSQASIDADIQTFLTAAKAQIDSASASVVSQLPVPEAATPVTSVDPADTLVLFEINPPSWAAVAGSEPIRFRPSDLWPAWKTFGTVMRELFLLGLAISFAFLSQKRIERYITMQFLVPEKTTKPEPSQIVVPFMGWGKQTAVTALSLSVIVISTAAAVVALNTNLGSLLTGATASTIITLTTATADTSLNGLGMAYHMMNVFIPIPAIFQFVSAHYIFAWSLPAIFTGVNALTKYLHI